MCSLRLKNTHPLQSTQCSVEVQFASLCFQYINCITDLQEETLCCIRYHVDEAQWCHGGSGGSVQPLGGLKKYHDHINRVLKLSKIPSTLLETLASDHVDWASMKGRCFLV